MLRPDTSLIPNHPSTTDSNRHHVGAASNNRTSFCSPMYSTTISYSLEHRQIRRQLSSSSTVFTCTHKWCTDDPKVPSSRRMPGCQRRRSDEHTHRKPASAFRAMRAVVWARKGWFGLCTCVRAPFVPKCVFNKLSGWVLLNYRRGWLAGYVLEVYITVVRSSSSTTANTLQSEPFSLRKLRPTCGRTAFAYSALLVWRHTASMCASERASWSNPFRQQFVAPHHKCEGVLQTVEWRHAEANVRFVIWIRTRSDTHANSHSHTQHTC